MSIYSRQLNLAANVAALVVVLFIACLIGQNLYLDMTGQKAGRQSLLPSFNLPGSNDAVIAAESTNSGGEDARLLAPSVSRGARNAGFREAIYMDSTAYSPLAGSHTASGSEVAVGLVAVDPSVIPLGTRLYIEGYGYAYAADTGGAIVGNRIDLFFDSEWQCNQWGRRTVKVYILE